jgi:tetratricopeptide (TPR) repeat protein
MISERFRRATRVAAVACFALSIATAAAAQTGQVRGKVVDAKGAPVIDAKVTLEFKGNVTKVYTTKTDKKGAYIQVGLQSGPWAITVEKGDLKQTLDTVVKLGDTAQLDFALVPGGMPGTAGAADVKAMEAKREELKGKFAAAVAMIDAQKYDEGIAEMRAIIVETTTCAVCEAKIGEALWKKGDEAGAEAAFKKSITDDPKAVDAYAALANLYNQQKKFDLAAEYSKKANEIAGSGAAGGGNASVIYNQGIIFWNQSKIAEAKAQFEQAVKLDPKMADAHYWLGMALVNEGNTADAKKSFETYLSLAPTGQYASMATAILKSIK